MTTAPVARPPLAALQQRLEAATNPAEFFRWAYLLHFFYPQHYRHPIRQGTSSLCLSRESRVQVLRERRARGLSLWHPGDLVNLPAEDDRGVGVVVRRGQNGGAYQGEVSRG